jgi:hypothetical protein
VQTARRFRYSLSQKPTPPSSSSQTSIPPPSADPGAFSRTPTLLDSWCTTTSGATIWLTTKIVTTSSPSFRTWWAVAIVVEIQSFQVRAGGFGRGDRSRLGGIPVVPLEGILEPQPGREAALLGRGHRLQRGNRSDVGIHHDFRAVHLAEEEEANGLARLVRNRVRPTRAAWKGGHLAFLEGPPSRGGAQARLAREHYQQLLVAVMEVVDARRLRRKLPQAQPEALAAGLVAESRASVLEAITDGLFVEARPVDVGHSRQDSRALRRKRRG